MIRPNNTGIFGVMLAASATLLMYLAANNSNTSDYLLKEGFTPAILTYFRAEEKAGHVYLSWDATDELELVGYQVERSTKDEDFQRLGWVFCREISGEPIYEFVAPGTKEGQTYFYRLKMVGFEGEEEYSQVITPIASGF